MSNQPLIDGGVGGGDSNVSGSSSIKMKRVIQHKSCTHKKADGVPCLVCKQIITLFFIHAKHCVKANCPIPYCGTIKQKAQLAQLQRRLQAQIAQPRMASMANMSQSQSSSRTNAPSTPFNPQHNQLYMEPAAATTQSSNEDDVAHSVEPEEEFDFELVNELLDKLELNH